MIPSLCVSKALAALWRRRTRGPVTIVLATATLCFCPPPGRNLCSSWSAHRSLGYEANRVRLEARFLEQREHLLGHVVILSSNKPMRNVTADRDRDRMLALAILV